MKFFKRRELTQDEKCEKARNNFWYNDGHMWSEWKDWGRLGGVGVRKCLNCGASETKSADPDYLNRLNNKSLKESNE